MRRIRLLLTSIAGICFLSAVELPGFIEDPAMHEQNRSFLWGADVNVHINAPGPDSLKIEKETLIIFYALPAGNSIAWTIGKKLQPDDDWHYDIQHIGAQTRFLRRILKDKNVITIYVQPLSKSWSLYAKAHPHDCLTSAKSGQFEVKN